jgi:hypothetical protein
MDPMFTSGDPSFWEGALLNGIQKVAVVPWPNLLSNHIW